MKLSSRSGFQGKNFVRDGSLIRPQLWLHNLMPATAEAFITIVIMTLGWGLFVGLAVLFAAKFGSHA